MATEENFVDALHKENAHLEDEIERATQKNQRIGAILAQKRRETERLQMQVKLIQGADQGYFLYIEQFRGRRQPMWWYVALLLSIVCVFGTWDKGAWVSFGFNVAAHKLLWRRWYVETSVASQTFALCIVAYTLAFVR